MYRIYTMLTQTVLLHALFFLYDLPLHYKYVSNILIIIIIIIYSILYTTQGNLTYYIKSLYYKLPVNQDQVTFVVRI